MNQMLTEITLVKIGVPNNILSFSILAKLNKDLRSLSKVLKPLSPSFKKLSI
jgi:hypothetical protein